MKIVKEWLEEFVPIPAGVTDEEIARRLSLSTVEVEGVSSSSEKGAWDHSVLGVITDIQPHPNADRLRVTFVDIGEKESVCIVCGGSNLAVGMSVAVALPGARVRWHGEGELVALEKTTIRGVDSYGMICASSEIGLEGRFPTKEEHEILDLSSISVKAGAPLAQLFGGEDTVFDIDNKSLSNRPDLWGHRGIAREVALLLRVPLKDPILPKIKAGKGASFSVDIQDRESCTRYMGVVVEGVSPIPSPEWIQKRLTLGGLRPINILVDVTNYVMLEYGQPMHAFDYDDLKKGSNGEVRIVVRNAKDGEKIETLDGATHALSSDMLVIADGKSPLAIAGVIGGTFSSVSGKTRTIVLEAANFHGPAIRRTSALLRIATESSRRFEKQLDAALPPLALTRAVQLLQSVFPQARVVSAVVDQYTKSAATKPLTLTVDLIARIAGMPISLARATDILKPLGFEVTKKDDRLSVRIPSFRRKDVAIVEDVVEELMRFIGYDSLPSALPCLPMSEPSIDTGRSLARDIKERLVTQYAFHETHQYAFARKGTLEACGLNLGHHFELTNPISDERPFICRSLVPNLLEAVVANQQKEKTIALFEIARVFLRSTPGSDGTTDSTNDVPDQPYHLACVYSSKEKGNHFAFVRSAITRMCADLGIVLQVREESSSEPFIAKGRSAGFTSGAIRVGYGGEVSHTTQGRLGIDDPVFVCELDLSLLATQEKTRVVYHAPIPFPSVRRDCTFVIVEETRYADVVACLENAHPLVRSVELFDIYRSEAIGHGKKSMSFHLIYQAGDRTLTTKEVDDVHSEVLVLLVKNYNAKIR